MASFPWPDDLRRAALAGSCSVRATAGLLACTQALQRAFLTPHHMANLRPATRTDPTLPLGGGEAVAGVPGPRKILLSQSTLPYACTTHAAMVTEALDGAQELGPEDVWDDKATLHYVTHQCAASEVAARELRRVTRRAKAYRFRCGRSTHTCHGQWRNARMPTPGSQA